MKGKEFLDEDFGYYLPWWEYPEYEDEIMHSYHDYEIYISYERLENGLIDWSEEIPQSVKRQYKIDQILGQSLDIKNDIGKFWPNDKKTN